MATGTLAEVVTEEVATNLEEVAQGVRRLNTTAVGTAIGGLAVGAAIGFYFGYRFNREKIRAEAFRQSEIEVEKIREVYQQKSIAAVPKPDIEKVMEEQGYSTAVDDERPLRPPVPVYEPPRVMEIEKDANTGWDYASEVAARSPEEPYVIHEDEYSESNSGYSQTAYTYYAGDDVLCNEENVPLPHADVIVGQDNLKFGHGSGDINTVFVRNERLEMEMEISRSPASYEEEILGLDRNEND